MCGITGYVSFTDNPSSSLLRSMSDTIVHRGPDSAGSYVDSHAALGIRRLSIIDLKTGDQPIKNEDGSIIVVFNGEIYNFQKLKKILIKDGHKFKTQTDTEVLVHLYEKYGENLCRYLNGMFAFALWDRKLKKLIVARDHAGIKPLYYSLQGHTLIFGSELKTILKFTKFSKGLDQSSLALYFYLGYIPQDQSMFTGIKKLQPGQIASFDKNGLKIKTYWDVRQLVARNEDFSAVFSQAVLDQSFADVPVGVLLSGGLDSSLVAYHLTKHKRQVKSFSISFDDPNFNEGEHARTVARHLETTHYNDNFGSLDLLEIFPQINSKLDEPLADPSLFPTYKVCELARKHVKVALSGDGGDELFGGYPTYQGHLFASLFSLLPKATFDILGRFTKYIPSNVKFGNYPLADVLKSALGGMKLSPAERHLRWMHLFLIGKNISDNMDQNEVYQKLISKPVNNSELVRSIQFLDFETYLADQMLVKVDRASMFNSLEVRVPFLDRRVIEYAFTPGRSHVDIFTTKKLLRDYLNKKLPKNIIKRKKKGFGIPLKSWLSGPLTPLVTDYLSLSRLHDFIPESTLQSIWQVHNSGKENYSKLIWSIVMFSSWLSKWGNIK